MTLMIGGELVAGGFDISWGSATSTGGFLVVCTYLSIIPHQASARDSFLDSK